LTTGATNENSKITKGILADRHFCVYGKRIASSEHALTMIQHIVRQNRKECKQQQLTEAARSMLRGSGEAAYLRGREDVSAGYFVHL
jgi:hypothetical protein